MIAGLRGRLFSKTTTGVIIDVHGVMYECLVSLSTLSELGEEGDEVQLIVHTNVREDALQLFGFSSEVEKKVFLSLIGVSGIGPKLALNMLSGVPATVLGQAIASNDLPKLTSIPGVGKKTAERLVVELREPLMKLLSIDMEKQVGRPGFAVEDELTSALANLGYKPKSVKKIVEKLIKKYPEDANIEELIRAALAEMHK